MITNFEKHTLDLNEEEVAMLSDIKETLIKFLSNNSVKVKSKDLVERINMVLVTESDYRLSDTKLRKFCNYFRSSGILPLLATSDGYYISYDKDEIGKQVKSLRERANSINSAAEGLERFLPDNYFLP